MPWVILNANRQPWGSETYPTEAAARQELREFWRGVSGVNLDRFYIEEIAEQPTQSTGANHVRPSA